MTDKIERSISIDHVARIEGKAGIEVVLEDGKVKVAKVNVYEGPRYFEAITIGKPIEEATAVFPRVCSFCAAAHKITGVEAAENAIGLKPSKQTMKLRELLYIGDYIESHALHLFLLALPDYLGYPDGFSMGKDHPSLLSSGMKLKDIGADLQTVIGSRYIHQENVLIGGFGKIPTKMALEKLAGRLKALRNIAEEPLEHLVSFKNWPEAQNDRVHLALKPYDGSYTMFGDNVFSTDGEDFKEAAYKLRIKESIVSHSFAKHGHYNEKPFMTGAISRYTLFGKGLTDRAKEITKMYKSHLDPNNPMSNNFAQAVEIIHYIYKAEEITNDLVSDLKRDEVRVKPNVIKRGVGVSMTEAPRGLLAYTIGVSKDGTVTEADIITPTVMFLPLMEDDLHRMADGLLQQGITDPKIIGPKLETIVRSYDPCVSCSVHITEVH